MTPASILSSLSAFSASVIGRSGATVAPAIALSTAETPSPLMFSTIFSYTSSRAASVTTIGVSPSPPKSSVCRTTAGTCFERIWKNLAPAWDLALDYNLTASVDPAKRHTTARVRNDCILVVEWLVELGKIVLLFYK